MHESNTHNHPWQAAVCRRNVVFDLWCVMFDLWCVMFDLWCVMFDSSLCGTDPTSTFSRRAAESSIRRSGVTTLSATRPTERPTIQIAFHAKEATENTKESRRHDGGEPTGERSWLQRFHQGA